MKLAEARRVFGGRDADGEPTESLKRRKRGQPLLYQVLNHVRLVIVGLPGSGKSTFLEWLQLRLAAVEEELVMGGNQAIPLLLRVRQLDLQHLPRGAALIEAATASKDRAALMPPDWIERHMKEGRILFMLDGLDETEPELRDRYLLPWLRDLCHQYSRCRYVISSRPVGYPPGMLRTLRFAECHLLDFEEPQIGEYVRHWCTAVRLARNEPTEEARREGVIDGERIVKSFTDHPYICNLARNPLMLSAICLVNYFEAGELPQDRALLYKLCVEGLLHHWDQRRGIRSEFGLEEKLRVCREVALAMQADDRAEYEAGRVQTIFAGVLGNAARADRLLEHIRYRTGLLLERRSGAFAFAHLTFQEYLAARAIHEGNQLRFDFKQLVREHSDGLWQEVIALYCGLTPAAAARDMIESLIAAQDTYTLAVVLAEAYFAAGPELVQDDDLRRRVLERIALAPRELEGGSTLERFTTDEVAPIVNLCIGWINSELDLSGAFAWLLTHPKQIHMETLTIQLREWRKMNSMQLTELLFLLHVYGSDAILTEIAMDASIYTAPGLKFGYGTDYGSQAMVALEGLAERQSRGRRNTPGVDIALLRILRALADAEEVCFHPMLWYRSRHFLHQYSQKGPPQDVATWPEFASLARRLSERLTEMKGSDPEIAGAIRTLNTWAGSLDRAIAARARKQTTSRTKSPARAVAQRSRKKGAPRGKQA
jgi:hypothetical protein